MTKGFQLLSVAGAAALLAGCFTVHHSEYPEVQMSCLPEGRSMSVQLTGFEATLTTYVPIYGYETVYRHMPVYTRHGHYCGGYTVPETYATTAYMPQPRSTSAFVERAQEALEGAGFSVNATGATYRVEVKFAGPIVTDGDRTAEALWLILSAFSADYGVQTWTAKLRIYDVASGALAMRADYTQKGSAAVWGPLPFLSPAGSDQTSDNTLQCWTLTALTDRAMADATAFLVSKSQ
ncbi:MAG: hypothetical protein ACI4R9_03070 [Kiritimatiellia bacterium]